LINSVRLPWREALNLPGAAQMQHLRAFIETRPTIGRVADQSLLAEPASGRDHARAMRADDFSWAAIYAPTPRNIELNLKQFPKKMYAAAYFDPVTGKTAPAPSFCGGERIPISPPNGTQEDWAYVLVVD
jgi:hypothetical protein